MIGKKLGAELKYPCLACQFIAMQYSMALFYEPYYVCNVMKINSSYIGCTHCDMHSFVLVYSYVPGYIV